MQKLIDAYRTSRSLEAARKLVAYMLKHPMAVCCLLPEDFTLIEEAQAQVRQ